MTLRDKPGIWCFLPKQLSIFTGGLRDLENKKWVFGGHLEQEKKVRYPHELCARL